MTNTLNSYRNQLEAYSAGHFWLFPGEFLSLMGRDEAIILSSIINFADQFNALSRYDGWFFLSLDKLETKIKMDKRTQQRYIKRLVEKGYLKTKRAGSPLKRYFFIETNKLNKDTLKARGTTHKKINPPEKMVCSKEYYKKLGFTLDIGFPL